MPIKNGQFVLDRSRSKRKAENILGVTHGDAAVNKAFRRRDLEEVTKYLESTQYDHLSDWNTKGVDGNAIPTKQRKPILIYNLAKTMSDTVGSKLLGQRVFPSFSIDEDPLSAELFKHVMKITDLKTKALDMSKDLPAYGSGFLRFKISDVNKTLVPILEKYNPNICYPEFDSAGGLNLMVVKYIYEDLEDVDEKGNPKQKWYKLELGKQVDILYNNPEANDDGAEPEFEVVSSVRHDFGFVQGEWFKTGEDKHLPDGPSLVGEVLDFIDAFNYSISKSDRAVDYNQEPQLVINGMMGDELDDLIKSSLSAWALGREGKAEYLESNLGGVETATKLRDKFRENIGDITRIIIQDPEKLIGSAQSAKAMEILHGPLLDLIDEIRPYVEKGIISLGQKMVAAILLTVEKGFEVSGVSIPEGYMPISLNLVALWPPVFPMTMTDLQQKVSTGAQAAQANVISRETVTKWLAKDFGIENVEEEIAKIAAQPVINPFAF